MKLEVVVIWVVAVLVCILNIQKISKGKPVHTLKVYKMEVCETE